MKILSARLDHVVCGAKKTRTPLLRLLSGDPSPSCLFGVLETVGLRVLPRGMGGSPGADKTRHHQQVFNYVLQLPFSDMQADPLRPGRWPKSPG